MEMESSMMAKNYSETRLFLPTAQKAANGFQALKELDANNDNKIDINDAAYTQLKIWQDVDGDGYSTADELHTLSDLGIKSINTGYTNSTLIDANGNEHKQIGSFTLERQHNKRSRRHMVSDRQDVHNSKRMGRCA